MEKDRQDALAVRGRAVIAEHALAGTGFALDHWIDRFEVGRVCSEAHADVPLGELTDALVSEVIFHIAISGDEARLVVRREFVEESGEGFPDEIREHIQATAVRHAHLDFEHSLLRAVFQKGIEHNHRPFTAFQGKALLAQEFLGEKVLKGLRLKQPAQGSHLHFHRFFRAFRAVLLDTLAHPMAHGGVVDVHELEADLARVGILESGHHVLQLHLGTVEEKRIGSLTGHFLLGKFVFAQRQARVDLGLVIERVDLSLGVAESAVVIHKTDNLAVELQIHQRRRRGRACGGLLRCAFCLRLGHTKLETFEKG